MSCWGLVELTGFCDNYPRNSFLDDERHFYSFMERHFAIELERLLRGFESQAKRLRILHLSDLHFGTRCARQNVALLEAELLDVVGEVDRVVVTGDMLDSPSDIARSEYDRFRLSIERSSRDHLVQVPGNHDVRVKGIVFDSRRQASYIPNAPIVCDDDSQVLFICFDSTMEGSFAKGRLPPRQLAERGSQLRNEVRGEGRRRGYLRVALVHHHPFSYGTEPKTRLQRILARVGLRDEQFLRMEHADEFLAWCADWDVSVILHGHKHFARYVAQPARTRNGDTKMLVAIGCGTSLGAEDLPMSYGLVGWDPNRRFWRVDSFESHRGGQFIPKQVSVTRHVPDVLALP